MSTTETTPEPESTDDWAPQGDDYVSDRKFTDFPISDELIKGILEHGYATATPVQAAPAPAAPSSSGTEWMQQLQAQTELRSGAGYANMAGHGFTLLDVAGTDLLPPSGATTIPVNLPLGYDYAIMGVCDNDCSDLDLAVLKSGVELSVDTSRDDWPVVQVVPTGTSSYEIKVSMYQCSHSSACGYQLTVWQRPQQAASPSASPDPVTNNNGSTVQGTLGAGDFTLPNGEWADVYNLDVQAGQTLSVSW